MWLVDKCLQTSAILIFTVCVKKTGFYPFNPIPHEWVPYWHPMLFPLYLRRVFFSGSEDVEGNRVNRPSQKNLHIFTLTNCKVRLLYIYPWNNWEKSTNNRPINWHLTHPLPCQVSSRNISYVQRARLLEKIKNDDEICRKNMNNMEIMEICI